MANRYRLAAALALCGVPGTLPAQVGGATRVVLVTGLSGEPRFATDARAEAASGRGELGGPMTIWESIIIVTLFSVAVIVIDEIIHARRRRKREREGGVRVPGH